MKKIITDSFSGGLITSCSEIKILGWSGPLTKIFARIFFLIFGLQTVIGTSCFFGMTLQSKMLFGYVTDVHIQCKRKFVSRCGLRLARTKRACCYRFLKCDITEELFLEF